MNNFNKMLSALFLGLVLFSAESFSMTDESSNSPKTPKQRAEAKRDRSQSPKRNEQKPAEPTVSTTSVNAEPVAPAKVEQDPEETKVQAPVSQADADDKGKGKEAKVEVPNINPEKKDESSSSNSPEVQASKESWSDWAKSKATAAYNKMPNLRNRKNAEPAKEEAKVEADQPAQTWSDWAFGKAPELNRRNGAIAAATAAAVTTVALYAKNEKANTLGNDYVVNPVNNNVVKPLKEVVKEHPKAAKGTAAAVTTAALATAAIIYREGISAKAANAKETISAYLPTLEGTKNKLSEYWESWKAAPTGKKALIGAGIATGIILARELNKYLSEDEAFDFDDANAQAKYQEVKELSWREIQKQFRVTLTKKQKNIKVDGFGIETLFAIARGSDESSDAYIFTDAPLKQINLVKILGKNAKAVEKARPSLRKLRNQFLNSLNEDQKALLTVLVAKYKVAAKAATE